METLEEKDAPWEVLGPARIEEDEAPGPRELEPVEEEDVSGEGVGYDPSGSSFAPYWIRYESKGRRRSCWRQSSSHWRLTSFVA